MNETPNRGYFSSTVGCFCPRCREGKLFKYGLSLRLNRLMEMNVRCPSCNQVTDIEVGFYYGTSYISYLLAIVLSAASFLLWWLIIGYSFTDDRFFYWLIFNAVTLVLLQPWLMRFSRSLWISWFVRYDPNWKKNKPAEPERINHTQMNNW